MHELLDFKHYYLFQLNAVTSQIRHFPRIPLTTQHHKNMTKSNQTTQRRTKESSKNEDRRKTKEKKGQNTKKTFQFLFFSHLYDKFSCIIVHNKISQ